MIFPSTRVRNLLKEYYDQGDQDDTLVPAIHELSRPFIEAIATSVHTGLRDELIQEGHLKLQEIIVKHTFNLARGSSLYSFLWHAIKNQMVSFCRKQPNCDDIDDMDVEDSPYPHWEDEDIADFLMFYGPARFPDIQEDVARDACIYVYEAVAETARERLRGVKRTLISEYQLSGDQADLMIAVVIIVMRIIMLGADINANVSFAIKAIEEGKQELVPEVYLFLGGLGSYFERVFSGQLW